jgi:hypothetical protein
MEATCRTGSEGTPVMLLVSDLIGCVVCSVLGLLVIGSIGRSGVQVKEKAVQMVSTYRDQIVRELDSMDPYDPGMLVR